MSGEGVDVSGKVMRYKAVVGGGGGELVVSRGQTLPGRKGLVQCLTFNTPQIIGGVTSGCGYDWHSFAPCTPLV